MDFVLSPNLRHSPLTLPHQLDDVGKIGRITAPARPIILLSQGLLYGFGVGAFTAPLAVFIDKIARATDRANRVFVPSGHVDDNQAVIISRHLAGYIRATPTSLIIAPVPHIDFIVLVNEGDYVAGIEIGGVHRIILLGIEAVNLSRHFSFLSGHLTLLSLIVTRQSIQLIKYIILQFN